jgi:flagellar biosynthesis regulator FlaF
LALDGLDTLEGVDGYWGFIIQGPVRTQEVVVGDEEGREGHRTIEVLKTTAGAGVEFIGAVEALDDLFESAVFGAFFIVVGQADNSATQKRRSQVLGFGLLVKSEGGRVVSGIAVGDELEGCVAGERTDSFLQGDEGITSAAGIGEVIGVDGAAGCTDREPGEVPSVGHVDIGFIAGDDLIERCFVMEVELVTEHGGLIQVVENRDIREIKAEDIFEHVSGHARTQAISNTKREDKAKGVRRALDAVNTAEVVGLG